MVPTFSMRRRLGGWAAAMADAYQHCLTMTIPIAARMKRAPAALSRTAGNGVNIIVWSASLPPRGNRQ